MLKRWNLNAKKGEPNVQRVTKGFSNMVLIRKSLHFIHKKIKFYSEKKKSLFREYFVSTNKLFSCNRTL